MKQKEWIVLGVALALIGGAGGLLQYLKAHQRLGAPGLKVRAVPGDNKLAIELPAQLPGYDAKAMEASAAEIGGLPRDTTFGKMLYRAPDGFETLVNVVLMGTDRTSIHKPQFCLKSQGWDIDRSDAATVPMSRPVPYDLPVMKLTTTRTGKLADGRTITVRGVYVYWFVADRSLTASHWARMWRMARELFRTGALQRWAYVTCFSNCLPGQEEALFNRMKQFMAAAVPEFQLAVGQTQAEAPGPDPVLTGLPLPIK